VSLTRCALLAGLVALLVPGAAAARDRCPAHTDEHVAARSARVVLLLGRSGVGTPRETQRLVGCSRASGRRRALAASPIESQVPLDGIVSLRLNGTRVVALSRAGDHLGGTWVTFSRGDALHGRLADVAERPGHLTEYAAGPRGEIAWIADGAVHLLALSATSSHVVATGAALHALRFRGDRLTWSDAGPAARATRGCCAKNRNRRQRV
jgi:hypothetical protein